ncbi:hypothetical protein ABTY96_03395 [Streptomyces sp. NPDC096057]|uniref:hypothetical protein n=1 Tax=Streptomyces sp. NPDC096057 TaxID=3155543 RepID=UPI003317E3A4
MAITGNLLSANAESIETDASAWSALVNAGTLAQASGGTLGAKSLSFKATAAGDAQIGLAARVAVTANTEYWSCASIFPPASGAQAFLEVRWYTSGGTLISTTAGPTISAPSATWFQIAAVGTAPATAATALVVLRVTATAAAQTWYTDRIFLGATTRSTGNLLSWNTETIEIDRSGWSADTNAALSISAASYTWYQSMLITSSAAGACLVRSVAADAPTVTPGVEYAAQVQVSPGVSALTFAIQIRWRDASGTEIGTSSASFTPTSGQWTRCTVAATAPVGAVTARVALAPTATAAGQQWVVDRMVLAPTSALMTAGNLLPYNVSDIEQNASGWTITGGTSVQTTEQVLGGAYALKVTSTGGDLVATLTVPVAAVPGYGYQFAPCVFHAVNRTYQTRIEWLNSAGVAVRTRWQSWSGTINVWQVGTMGDLAPAGAVSARLSLIIPGTSAGEVWYLDRVEWKLGGLTVSALPVAGGGAAITVRGLTTGGPTWLWSLERIISGQASQPVRGWTGDLTSQTIAGDIAVATDYEAPLGVTVQWRATVKNPSGSGIFLYTSDPLTLDAETTDVWLKDPGNPARSTRVTVATPMPTWTTDARQGVNKVVGRGLPVVISDVRSGKTGDLTVVTETDADRQALSWVLETGNVLLLQWPPGWGEDDIYVSVGGVQLAPVVDYAEFHDRTWVLPLTQVDRPIGGVVGSADRTWQTVKDGNATWADVLAGASSWLDVYTGA